jgi:transcriptional regulator with XRE-family HTH domain
MSISMGLRIKTLRESKGLTQQGLADALGVTRAAVSLWELDQTKNIKNVTMLALVQILGTTQEYLLFGPAGDKESTGRFRKPGGSM